MKYLFLLLFSLSAGASNWMPLSKIQSGSSIGYQLESECERFGEQCLDVGDKPEAVALGFYSLEPVMVDNVKSPIWGTRSMIEPCLGEVECQAKALEKKCIDGREAYYNAEYSETWCNEILGYNQMDSGERRFIFNQAEWDKYQAKEKSREALARVEENKRQMIREKLKDFDKSKLSTVAALRDFVAELVELLK